MVEQQPAAAVRVQAADVADVVAVLLHEPDHGIFVAEVEIAALRRAAGDHWPVVADLVGAAVRGALVEVRAAVRVVGLPGGIRCLENDVGMAAVVADHESDVALTAGVRAGEQREVDAGDGRRGDVPGGRDGPGTAVIQLCGEVGEALRLRLAEGGRSDVGNLAGAEALVPAGAVDRDGVVGSFRVHLELHRLAGVDAHFGGEALDGVIAGSIDVPLVGGSAGFGVLAGDRIDQGRAGVGRRGSCQERGGQAQGEQRRHQREGQRDDDPPERCQWPLGG
ncbi:hypothetical protein ARUL111621_08960 [Arthrobacter ulcerisalmonis]